MGRARMASGWASSTTWENRTAWPGWDADGYRMQSVTVNNRVYGGTGAAAGVWLAGGGRVFIGPMGTVGAESGVAIRADGGTATKLYIDMNLDGRRVANVIGDDWIINDGGQTTIVVNEVKLHDGIDGVVPGRFRTEWGLRCFDKRRWVDRGYQHRPVDYQ